MDHFKCEGGKFLKYRQGRNVKPCFYFLISDNIYQNGVTTATHMKTLIKELSKKIYQLFDEVEYGKIQMAVLNNTAV